MYIYIYICIYIYGKDECQVRLTGMRKCWMDTEISRLGGYGFRGTVTAGDESNQKGGKMGAGYVNLFFVYCTAEARMHPHA